MHPWTPANLPHSPEKTFVVTGGNAGIGFFIAEQLLDTGAEVILACRSEERAAAAITTLSAHKPHGRLGFIRLDLADPASITAAAADIRALPRVDGLILNGGAKIVDTRTETRAGEELVFGTNQLGNFALIARVLDALERRPGARIITMGSLGYLVARLDPRDIDHRSGSYAGLATYTASKYAQMLTARELDRRLRAAGMGTRSLIAQPGVALDELGPRREPALPYRPWAPLRARTARLLFQGKDAGAWPAVRATLDPAAQGGSLWGPRFLASRGAPVRARLPRRLRAENLAARIWSLSEERTGLPLLPEFAPRG